MQVRVPSLTKSRRMQFGSSFTSSMTDAVWMSKEDLLPLLQASAPEVRSEALVFMTEVS